MDNAQKYRISLLGEFTDKPIENEFLADSLSGSTRITAYIALVFGAILGLFLLNSYFVEGNTPLFLKTTPIRLVFISTSIAVYFIAKRITEHKHLVYIITFYQGMMALIYLLTLKQYDSLNYFSVLALMVITLAIYLLPNKVILSQIIAVIFSIVFFIFPIRKLEGLQPHEFYRILAYQTILLVYCNINHCWAERTKRKTFIAKREISRLSSKDPVTGVYNRKKFDEALDEWIGFSKRYGNPLSLILLDVDNFKEVNDTYGHIVGDSVLKSVAATVSQSIRDTDVFARWGGDEFALLLPNTDIRQAEKLAERIRKCISSSSSDNPKDITCSFGVAAYEEHDTKQSLLRKVDDLLLQAKTSGKNIVIS
ncbi:MAG TPA: GGDEF domain-containing protein [Firmicutes bacterium]|nr:GGDEF domain-containing protein [Bacillota bacterium]